MKNKRRNYPGDLRTPGTKDYGVILSNLRKYCHGLDDTPNDDKIYELFLKLREKLKELGYRKESLSVDRKMKSMANWDKKRQDVMAMGINVWGEAKEKHEIAKARNKEKEKIELHFVLDNSKINSNFFMRLKCFSINLIKLLLIERKIIFTSLNDKYYCLILTALNSYQKSTNSTQIQLNE